MMMNAAHLECKAIQVTEKQWNMVAGRHAVVQRVCVRQGEQVKGTWM